MATTPHPTHRIEMFQRSAARYVENDYHYTSSVTNMLRELKWSTLEQRRNKVSLTMLHKIHITNRSMSITIMLQLHETTYSLGLFPTQNDITTLWNELPTEIKDDPTVPAFVSGLNKFYAFY